MCKRLGSQKRYRESAKRHFAISTDDSKVESKTKSKNPNGADSSKSTF